MGIILGDNPAGQCFALGDLIPIKLMVVKLKICTVCKIFGNIFLKAIRDTFMWSEIKGWMGYNIKGRERVQFFVGDYIQQKEEIQNFGHAEREGESSLVSLLMRNFDSLIRNTPRSVSGLLTVVILRRVRKNKVIKIYMTSFFTYFHYFILF